jgi:hypothetical protein
MCLMWQVGSLFRDPAFSAERAVDLVNDYRVCVCSNGALVTVRHPPSHSATTASLLLVVLLTHMLEARPRNTVCG